MSERLYAQRDIRAQRHYYTRHVDAMTGEALHAKSAIAAELAHRDMEIERLLAEVAAIRKDAERYRWLRDRCPWMMSSGQALTRLALRLPIGYQCHAEGVNDMDAAVDGAMACVQEGA